ncbi:MAG: glycosyltransferase, partial [Acidimicrobiia bacterium]
GYGALRSAGRVRRATMSELALSVVVPAWDALPYTQRCVEASRAHRDVPYELVLVDNGSAADAARYAAAAGDVTILNDTNLGFAVGMNQGLRAAHGEFVAFVNNDTVVPANWASTLLALFDVHPSAGIVIPVVTAAGNEFSVRDRVGEGWLVVEPFTAIPSAVVYVVRRSVMLEMGGWSETYPVASSEDLDLLFTVWSNGLDVLLDERVLVEHESAVSANRLPDHGPRWRANREIFVNKWSSATAEAVPRLTVCPEETHAANLAKARVAAVWMARWFAAKDELASAARVPARQEDGETGTPRRSPGLRTLAALWSGARRFVPRKVREWLYPRVRGLYHRTFPHGRR